MLQAAFNEVPQLTRERCQKDERGAHPFQQQCPPVQFCHRGAAELPHVSVVQEHCAHPVCSAVHAHAELGGYLLLLMTSDTCYFC